MNILFLRSNPVDPDSRVEKETDALLHAGYSVRIFGWDRNKNGKNYIRQKKLQFGSVSIECCCIKAGYGLPMRQMLLPLFRFEWALLIYLIRNHKSYDVLHACDFDTVFVAFIVSKILNKKIVYDIFDYYVDAFMVPAFLKRLIRDIDTQIINRSDAVILCTEERIKQISPANPKQLYVVHNSPKKQKLDKFNLEMRDKEKRIKIVYVGILAEDRLLKELIDLMTEMKDFELHLGGFGSLEGYIREIVDKEPNIHFYGRLSYNETLALENQCDLMTAIYNPVIKNHCYAAPNKFYEAMMLGKPLIACKNTGFDSYVSECGGKVIEYSRDGLRLALLELKDERENWGKTGELMKELYASKFSWDFSEVQLQKCYKNIENL